MFAETCVFGKQSLEPIYCGPLTPWQQARKLLGHPFFRRYGVMLPSSLTEGRSCTLGGFPQPTGVGVRYGQRTISLAAFLGGLGVGDFRSLAQTRARGHARESRTCPRLTLPTGSPSCPFDGFTFPTASPLHCITIASGAGLSHLLAIAYDYDVLGLGPD